MAKSDQTPDAPLYDPSVHTEADGDPVVYVEMFCKCGSARRQRDEVSKVRPNVVDFLANHQGPRHGEVTKAEFVDIREERAKAAHVLAGTAEEYTPREYPNLHIDDEPRPWPVLEG